MSFSLPLPVPLPLTSPHVLYVQLLPLQYLAVCAMETRGKVYAQYYIVEVSLNKGQDGREEEIGDSEEDSNIPKIFHNVVSLTELNDVQLVQDSLRSIAGNHSLSISLSLITHTHTHTLSLSLIIQ